MISRRRTLHVISAALGTATLLLATVSLGGAWDIDSPYAEVNWSQYKQVKANLHTHTKQSDGRLQPAEVIDKYRSLGYGILALTDHNKVTWPWKTYDRDPSALKMVAIQAAEASRHHHMNTYFCNVAGVKELTGSLAKVREQKGIAVLNHPGRYRWPAEKYTELYTDWKELVGMEVFNQGDRYSKDRQKWDEVLTMLIPKGRLVWGFSNDDMHGLGHLGRNWNILLLKELRDDSVRHAMENGLHFFAYSRQGHKEGASVPSIQSVEVNSAKGTIEISARDHERIEWISAGVKVHEGPKIDLSAVGNARHYVRAVLHGKGGNSVLCTQPFVIRPKGQ